MSRKKKRKGTGSPGAEGGNRDAAHGAAPRTRMPSVLAAALLVFVSGCAALAFQVTWMRELRLIFGATTVSVSAVLAIFMGGLGVGSAVLGKLADRAPRPLRMYGQLEVGVSLAVAVSPLLLWIAEQTYLGLGGQAGLGLLGATVVRLLLAILVMGTPAFLMGGTLPAITRSVTRPGDAHRGALALLYGANTFGAVAGTAVTTFVALEWLGTLATLWGACALSTVAGLFAWWWAMRLDPVPVEGVGPATESDGAPPAQAARSEHAAPASTPWLVYFTAAAVGFTFFALEIVWYRMLAPILGGTTFTFGTILGVALFGIGLGGLAYTMVFSRWVRPTMGALAVTCSLEAALTVGPYALGDRLAVFAAWQTSQAETFRELAGGWILVTSIVVLGAAFVSGLQFPLLIALLGEGRGAVSRHVGTAYAWNTLGAISGSLVAGFGALPLLTAPGMWLAVGGALALLSLVLVFSDRSGSAGTKAVAGALVAATAVFALFPGPTAGWRHSGIGAGRANFASFDPNAVEFLLAENRRGLAWEADGLEASIGIRDFDGYEFVVNGKVDGNSLSDAPTQVGVALLGAVLHEDPKTAMVIGLGTGESVGWLAEMRGIERVDAVELEPAIDKMVELCAPVNYDALHHPEVRRIYNDGRETVFTSNEKYDVIVSEPSNPYRAGVATLYTTEFYQAASRRLNEGGVFVQFLQAYEVDNPTVATVLATVRSAFKHVEVWQTLPVDLQLVCSNEPLDYTSDDLRRRIESPVVKQAIERVWRTKGVEGFLSHFIASAGWVDHVTGLPYAKINSDDRTVLEYRFAKTVGQPTGFSVEDARAMLSQDQDRWHLPDIEDESIDWEEVEVLHQISNCVFKGALSTALLSEPDNVALVQALDAYRAGDFRAALQSWPAAYDEPDNGMLRLARAHCLAELAEPGSLELVEPLAEDYPADVHAVRTICHWYAGRPAEAEASFAAMIETLREAPWGWVQILQMAFDRSIDIAKQSPDAAKRVDALIAEPLSVHRLEYMRRIGRVFVSMEMNDPHRVAKAFELLEPNAPWRLGLLEARAEAYRATNHPLASRAETDVQQFRSQASGR